MGLINVINNVSKDNLGDLKPLESDFDMETKLDSETVPSMGLKPHSIPVNESQSSPNISLSPRNNSVMKRPISFAEVIRTVAMVIVVLFLFAALAHFWTKPKSPSELYLENIEKSLTRAFEWSVHMSCPSNKWTFVGPDGLMTSCYLLYLEKLNFFDARSYCQKNGGDLLSIQSSSEVTYIKQIIEPFGGTFWIGATNAFTGLWVWIHNNEEISDQEWRANTWNAPSGDIHCGIVTRYGAQWDSVSCDDLVQVVCEFEIHEPEPKKQVNQDVHCPKNDSQSCYIIQKKKMSKRSSSASCHKKGGYLARINDKDEENFLVGMVFGTGEGMLFHASNHKELEVKLKNDSSVEKPAKLWGTGGTGIAESHLKARKKRSVEGDLVAYSMLDNVFGESGGDSESGVNMPTFGEKDPKLWYIGNTSLSIQKKP